MRLLFLTSRLPYPPNRGDRRRVLDFLIRLSQDHEITLLSFISNDAEKKNIPVLQQYCGEVQVIRKSHLQSVLTVGLNFLRNLPLQVLYYRSHAMQNQVDQVLSELHFDAVYVHLFRMAPYVTCHSDLYRIADLTDVISQEILRAMPYRNLLTRILYTVERSRIEHYERWVARNFEETWLISNADAKVLAASCPVRNIQVIPHGVDLNVFHPTVQVSESNSLIFVGNMSVFHNVDAVTFLVREILPLVRSEIPDCTLKIVGADPIPHVQKLALEPGIEVTGFVHDLNEALNQAVLFVAPLRFAAGVQTKVVEAMAAGCPVISTSIVNQGLGAQPGQDLLIADTPEEIAAAILNLLLDEILREQIRLAARRFVKIHYRRDFVSNRLESIQENLDKLGRGIY